MTYRRPEDIPTVRCPYCGEDHRPDAIDVSMKDDAKPWYMAGHVECPKYNEDVDAATVAGTTPPVWPSPSAPSAGTRSS